MEEKRKTSTRKRLEKHLNPEKVETLLKISSDIRVKQALRPRLKFKADRPDQMEFIGDDYQFNIALCGNRWGKSFAMAYKATSIATCEDPKAKHQPDPARDIEMLFVGPSWTKITDTIQKDILNLLRKDEYKTKSNGTYINKIFVTAPNGGKVTMSFMPSSSEKKEDSQEFEGSEYHYVFVDEGISEELFRKIIVRMGSLKGVFYQAFTRLPDTIHLAGHLIDLEKGKGDFKDLIDEGLVNIVAAATMDNKYLDAEEIATIIAGSAKGNDKKLYKEYEQIKHLTDRVAELRKEKLLYEMSDLFKARVYGIVTKPTGAVFNFREQVKKKNYNVVSMAELAEIMFSEEGDWYLKHDFGQSAPATWTLCWCSRKTGTIYNVDEVYRKGMSIQESAEACYDMCKRWEAYGHIKYCFADKQIRDKGNKDKRVDSQLTIEQMYKQKYAKPTIVTKENGSQIVIDGEPCFHPNMQFVCSQSDKNNRMHTLQVLAEMIDEENPLTPGLPYIRWTLKCENGIREHIQLRWSTKIHKQSGASYEDTDGDDHCVDPERYMINRKVNLIIWSRRHSMRVESNDLAYKVGGSANPLFNM